MSNGSLQQAKRILIVEDDDHIGEAILEIFASETSYVAMLVKRCENVLAVMHDQQPDLLILDYNLPFQTGLQCYDHFHSIDAFNHIPAIIMSANAPVQEIQKRHLLYLHKPFSIQILLSTVEKALL